MINFADRSSASKSHCEGVLKGRMKQSLIKDFKDNFSR